MNNAKWTWFAIGYECGFAYIVAFMINTLGNFLIFGQFGIGTVAGLVVLVAFLYMLFRKDHAKKLEAASKKIAA